MPDAAFDALVARVGEFHITDKAMRAAQERASAAVRDGRADDRLRDEYLAAVRRYFAPFEREARAHLRDVDRRLEHANQVVFNLVAERGVAVKRIEATQGVLADVARLDGENAP